MAHLSVVRHTRVFQLTVNNTMFSLNLKKPSFSERQRLQAPTGGRRRQENTTIWKNLASLSKSDTLLPTGTFVALFEEACVICGLSYSYSLDMVMERLDLRSILVLTGSNWEEIKIEEESEDGKKVESVIRVPAQYT
ncbi:hypothetical protein P5673_011835 [Acropora cervicornis]|uniref:Uncharacterized protein n=1 Tax=Acropora cervicornis TaxID=6130 RepID=A0AAD9V7Q7_ACRCE|nr:hypothetical protein P5673_011835 [Acropora cervicornis]